MSTDSFSGQTKFKPYVPADDQRAEFTARALILGTILGLVFSASSLYLVLKVGMTVSASIPVAVLAITFFRIFSRFTGGPATILENNIVQTAGSAGESIAFGVGVTMPALLLLGFQMDLARVMTVSLLGGLLGILAMNPLRRAFTGHAFVSRGDGVCPGSDLGRKGWLDGIYRIYGIWDRFTPQVLNRGADGPDGHLQVSVGFHQPCRRFLIGYGQ